MKRTDSGLFVAHNFSFLRRFGRAKGTVRTVTLPNGERAKVTVDDSRTVRHTEHGDHLDALVRPAAIRGQLVLINPSTGKGGFARPGPIRTALGMKGPR